MKTNFFHIFMLAILSFLASLYGLGASYHSLITPISNQGEFSRIFPDKWIENGAEIILKNLASRGNRLDLKLTKWRPGDPAKLSVSVCGEIASEFTVDTDNIYTVYLKGDCEPRVVKFSVQNPFIASSKDKRALAAQLSSAQVTSKVGTTILNFKYLSLSTLGIFTLSVLSLYLFPFAVLSYLVSIFCFYLLKISPSLYLTPAFSLWIFMTALLLGALIQKNFKEKSRFFIRVSSFWIFIILIIGSAIRIYGIQFGLPNTFHPDEVPKFNAISRMISYGDLNPRYFLHPTVLLYCTYFINHITQWINPSSNWSETLILSGRFGSTAAGIFSIYLTYFIGNTLFSKTSGLTAALILALSPLHITCSRYVKEDAILTFFILLSVALIIKGSKENKKILIYLSGLAAGAAASTKYSGILTGFVILAAPFLSSNSFKPNKDLFLTTVISLLFVPIGFVLFSPYILLDFNTFLKDFISEKDHMSRGHMIVIDSWSQFWMYHHYRSILPGMTVLAALAGTIGLGILAFQKDIKSLFIIALFLLFYLPAEFVNAKPAPQPERYILPCLPFLCIAAGCLLSKLQLRSIKLFGFILILITTIQGYRSLTLASELMPDTRDTMREWMLINIPRTSKVVVDWKPYNPPFKEGEFEITYMPREDIISSLRVADLKASGSEYLLLSSLYYSRYFDQPNVDPAFREVFRKVFKTFPEVKTFSAINGTYGFHNPKLTLMKIE